jgi:hypothetical protein
MTSWRRYDATLFPIFHERFEEKWGKGSAPFLDPGVFFEEQPRPRAQWINVDTGAAVAVVPIWADENGRHRSFGVFYLPPTGDIWVLRPGLTEYVEARGALTEEQASLRNDAFRKAVAHAKAFIFGHED